MITVARIHQLTALHAANFRSASRAPSIAVRPLRFTSNYRLIITLIDLSLDVFPLGSSY